jgi:hypothetical protein
MGGERRKAMAMIGVLVGDEDAVERSRAGTEILQSAQGFAFRKAGIDEETGALGFDKGAVSRAAGGQNGNSKRGAFSPLNGEVSQRRGVTSISLVIDDL